MEKQEGKPKYSFENRFRAFLEKPVHSVPFAFVSSLPFEKCVSRLSELRIETGRHSQRVKVNYHTYKEEDYRICQFFINQGHYVTEVAGQIVAYPGATSTHVEGEILLRRKAQLGYAFLWGIALILLPLLAYYLWQAKNYGHAGAMCVAIFLFIPTFWFLSFSYHKSLLREIHTRLKA